MYLIIPSLKYKDFNGWYPAYAYNTYNAALENSIVGAYNLSTGLA